MAPDTDPHKLKRKAKQPQKEPRTENPGVEDDLQERYAELEARLLRVQADYQNLRRRSLLDLEAALKREMQPLLEELLLVLDFLDMALATPATNEETRNLAMGVELTRTKFIQALEAAEVRSIPTEGMFDPKLHDATEAVELPDREPGTIVETVRRGFVWREHVLRPARVKVVAGERASAEEPEDDTTEASAEESTPDLATLDEPEAIERDADL